MGTGGKEFGDSGRGGVDVLEAIEDEQKLLSCQGRGQALFDRPTSGLWYINRPRNRCQKPSGVAERGKIDEDDPVGEVAPNDLCHPQRQPRLPNATGPGQGE
jgi:hypothetical protein